MSWESVASEIARELGLPEGEATPDGIRRAFKSTVARCADYERRLRDAQVVVDAQRRLYAGMVEWSRGENAEELRRLHEDCERIVGQSIANVTNTPPPTTTVQCDMAEEIERLRAKVARLESGDDYDPHAVRVMHVTANPHRNAEVAMLTVENEALKEKLRQVAEANASIPTVTAAQTAPAFDPKKHAQRLKEMFAAQVKVFREVICAALGYQVTETKLHEYQLLSIYAERKEDTIVLLFDEAAGKLRIIENEFAARQKNNDAVWGWLSRHQSIPGFLAQLTLHLLENTTAMT